MKENGVGVVHDEEGTGEVEGGWGGRAGSDGACASYRAFQGALSLQ